MDMNHKSVESDANTNNLQSVESPEAAVNGESDKDDESQALLRSQESGLPNESEKPRRKVQWLDKDGEKLAQILEFEPSDVSDSDEEDSDSCLCRIM